MGDCMRPGITLGALVRRYDVGVMARTADQDEETCSVTVRMPVWLKESVEEKAAKQHRSMASGIRWALRLWVTGETED